MSLTSKITLGAAITFSVSVITYVHVSQKRAQEVNLRSQVKYCTVRSITHAVIILRLLYAPPV